MKGFDLLKSSCYFLQFQTIRQLSRGYFLQFQLKCKCKFQNLSITISPNYNKTLDITSSSSPNPNCYRFSICCETTHEFERTNKQLVPSFPRKIFETQITIFFPVEKLLNPFQFDLKINNLVEESAMGIIKSSLSLMIGTAFGIYVAQNYDVPNIHKLYKTGLVIAKHYEEERRRR